MDFDCSPFIKIIEKTLLKVLLIDLTFFVISNGTPLSEIISVFLCSLRTDQDFFSI